MNNTVCIDVPVFQETPWLEIAGAVGLALLDIFKGPPEESTDTSAPGLKANWGIPVILRLLRHCFKIGEDVAIWKGSRVQC